MQEAPPEKDPYLALVKEAVRRAQALQHDLDAFAHNGQEQGEPMSRGREHLPW